MVVFICYARKDEAEVQLLAGDVERARRKVWWDSELTGGQAWWNTILQQIRDCGLFLFVLSPDSLESRACIAEFHYALALGRPLLAVMVRRVPVQLAPNEIADSQIVDYRERTANSAIALLNALATAPPPGPLPLEMPTPPSVPISYMHSFSELIEQGDLTYRQQATLVVDLKAHLSVIDDREVAIGLLHQLRQRPDLAQAVANEIDALGAIQPTPGPGPAPPPEPIPQPESTPRPGLAPILTWFRRHWKPAATVLGAVLVVAVVGTGVGLLTGETPGATTVVTNPSLSEVAVQRSLETADDPADIEWQDGDLGVSSGAGTLERIDPRTGIRSDLIDFGESGGNDLLIDDGELALTLFGGSAVGFVDLASSEPEVVAVEGCLPLNGAVASSGFWFACQAEESGFLVRMEDRSEVQRIPVEYKPNGVVAEGDLVFVTFSDSGRLGRIDLGTGDVQSVTVGSTPIDLALINGDLWVTLAGSDEVAVHDSNTLAVKARYPVGRQPWKLAVGLGSVWVTNKGEPDKGIPGGVSRLDPGTGRKQQPDVPVGLDADEVAVGDAEVYVANRREASITVLGFVPRS